MTVKSLVAYEPILPPHHCLQILCGHPLRQNCCQQGHLQRPCSETQGSTGGQGQVRRQVQDRQEQMVHPEAAVLDLFCFSH